MRLKRKTTGEASCVWHIFKISLGWCSRNKHKRKWVFIGYKGQKANLTDFTISLRYNAIYNNILYMKLLLSIQKTQIRIQSFYQWRSCEFRYTV